jgi:hypothetical protein
MAEDVKIFDGTNWKSLKGADGAEGPTVVSANPNNATKLGTDGRIFTPPATETTIGAVKAGSGLGIGADGLLVVSPAVSLPSESGGLADTAAGSVGLSVLFAREDHTHPYPTAAQVGAITQTEADARYVEVAGDTMKGTLAIERDGPTGSATVQPRVYSDTFSPNVVFTKTRGTKAAQTPIIAGDYLGRINFNTITTTGTTITNNIQCVANAAATATGVDTRLSFVTSNAAGATAEVVTFASDYIRLRTPLTDLVRVTNGLSGLALEVIASTASGNSVNQGWGVSSRADLVTKNACCFNATNTGKGTEFNTCFQVDTTLPAGANNYSIYGGSPAQNYFRGNVGINWTTPTANLEVQGTAKIRGTLEVTGNITSAGTAHAFAAGSITASAIGGSFGTLTASTVSAAGGRSNFAPLSEPFAIGIRHNAAGLPNYIGTTATGAFQVSEAGGSPILSITGTGNITSTGTAHSFAAKSIPASAINGLTSGATAANDLTDVTVSAPAVGQVLRFDGTNFVNAKLNFSDLSGTQTNPTINPPSIFKVFALATGQTDAGRACAVMSAAPVASATITGVQGYQGSPTGPYGIFSLILGKVNTVTKVFAGGVATYSGWVSMSLGADERHACVFPGGDSNITGQKYSIRYYTATENSNWSTEVQGTI